MRARQRDPDNEDESWDEWIRRIIDTRDGPDLGRMAMPGPGGTLVSWHVTDQPARLIAFLRRRGDLVAGYGERGRSNELGPGLYLGSPHFWHVRSRKKWDFLDRMGPAGLHSLTTWLSRQLGRDEDFGRITPRERVQGERAITCVVSERCPVEHLVDVLANQPYGYAFSAPHILNDLGIDPGPQPEVVEVAFRGKLAELNGSYPPRPLLRLLRRAGLQGAFTRHGLSAHGEIVLWDRRAIVSAALDPGGLL